MKKWHLIFLTLLSTPLYGANLSASVSGFENAQGHLRFALFSKARQEAFPRETDKADYVRDLEIRNGQAQVSLCDIPPGTYAVFLFHDSNDNGVVDHRWYGPPEEAFAYYRIFKVRLLPPEFDEVAFQVKDADIEMEIPLQHF